MSGKLIITVEGPDKAGKGHVIAAITHKLQELGMQVLVQGGETHNAPKLSKTDEELFDKLVGKPVLIMEQQT